MKTPAEVEAEMAKMKAQQAQQMGEEAVAQAGGQQAGINGANAVAQQPQQ